MSRSRRKLRDLLRQEFDLQLTDEQFRTLGIEQIREKIREKKREPGTKALEVPI